MMRILLTKARLSRQMATSTNHTRRNPIQHTLFIRVSLSLSLSFHRTNAKLSTFIKPRPSHFPLLQTHISWQWHAVCFPTGDLPIRPPSETVVDVCHRTDFDFSHLVEHKQSHLLAPRKDLNCLMYIATYSPQFSPRVSRFGKEKDVMNLGERRKRMFITT